MNPSASAVQRRGIAAVAVHTVALAAKRRSPTSTVGRTQGRTAAYKYIYIIMSREDLVHDVRTSCLMKKIVIVRMYDSNKR